MNTLGGPIGQIFLDHLTTVDGGSVPKDQQLARNMSQQMPQKVDHIWALIGPLLNHHVEFAFRGDPTNDRKVVVSQILTDNRRLAYRSIGAQDCRQQVETRLVHKHQGAFSLYSFF